MKYAFFVLLCLILPCLSSGDSLQKKYPYARLTPDYGILSEEDLLISEQDADPTPLSQNSQAYPYWQCFLTSQIEFACPDLEKDDGGTPMSDILIKVKSNKQYEEFSGRHAVPLSTCQKEYVEKWNHLTHGEKYTCVAGISMNSEAKNINGKKITSRTWTYDRLKTKKGCVSYFEGECSLKK